MNLLTAKTTTMKQLLFLNLWIFVFIVNGAFSGYSKNPFFIKKGIETTNRTSLTNLKECINTCTSYKKVPCTYNSIKCTSPQRDTTKKQQPNKGLGQQKRQNVASTEIDGLLLDATFSPGGYEFYVDFSHNWTPPANAANYKIVVKEYQGRGTNMVVAIEVNDKQLVFRRMRPLYSAIHDLATTAATYLNGYITRGDHLRGIDADGNFIDVQQNDVTRKIKTPFDIY